MIGADHIDKDQPVKFEGNTFLNYPNEVQRRYALKIYLIINQEKLRSILRPFLFYWHELLQFCIHLSSLQSVQSLDYLNQLHLLYLFFLHDVCIGFFFQ